MMMMVVYTVTRQLPPFSIPRGVRISLHDVAPVNSLWALLFSRISPQKVVSGKMPLFSLPSLLPRFELGLFDAQPHTCGGPPERRALHLLVPPRRFLSLEERWG